MKRIISLILTVMLFLTIGNVGVFAEGNETDPNSVNNTTQDAGETSEDPKEDSETGNEGEEETDQEDEESVFVKEADSA